MVEKNVFKAQAGRSYVLSVEFSDGNTFASDTVRMYAPPTIDSIYAKPAVKQYIVTDADGNESLKNIPALEVLCAVSTTDLDKNYCRFSVCALSQMLSFTLGMSRYTVYHWTSSLLVNTNAEQTTGEVVDGRMVIKGKHLGYLEYKEGSATKEESAVLPAGWIVTTYAYRIAPQSYTYYQKIQKQLEAKGHFFDPVSSQIKGNMHCVNQSDKLVLGLFEANSQAKKITAFYWNSYRKDYVKKELVNFVDTISTGGRSQQMPGFWVSF